MTGAEAFADASNPLMAKVRPAASRRFFDTATALDGEGLPGRITYMTKKTDEVLVTVLGSCVSACIRDPRRGRRHESFHASAARVGRLGQ